ncbi:hypothetical protein AVEN_52907-1 [Araneus ventricosus]|uniref:Uncharacterized protein n=1 Tax=Araneus ventricosus TaxID=182803 RepID=A0A4Y2FGU6_ARAVE|nr:hypothetical protein AVEN_52907-1 [Araneus ventricosus]
MRKIWFFKIYACDFQCLDLILENVIFRGICYLLNWDDESFGIIGRRGIKTLSILPISVRTVAFITFGPRCVIRNRVPLPCLGILRLRISSIGTPTVNLGLSEGAPDSSKMLKSSTEYDVPCQFLLPYLQMDIL